jgi:hypothetical protein
MRTRNAIAIGALVLLSSACGGTREVTQPSGFPSGPTSFASASVSPAVGTLPTTSPGAATGRLVSGTASAQLSGDLTGNRAFTALAPPVLFSPPPGAMAVVWQTTAADETLSVTGSSFTGQQPTSATLTLTLNVRNGTDAVLLTSSAGECTVTIDQAVQSALHGSFTCQRLTGSTTTGDLSVDATGTFSASG